MVFLSSSWKDQRVASMYGDLAVCPISDTRNMPGKPLGDILPGNCNVPLWALFVEARQATLAHKIQTESRYCDTPTHQDDSRGVAPESPFASDSTNVRISVQEGPAFQNYTKMFSLCVDAPSVPPLALKQEV
jgi:hypothetical protein